MNQARWCAMAAVALATVISGACGGDDDAGGDGHGDGGSGCWADDWGCYCSDRVDDLRASGQIAEGTEIMASCSRGDVGGRAICHGSGFPLQPCWCLAYSCIEDDSVGADGCSCSHFGPDSPAEVQAGASASCTGASCCLDGTPPADCWCSSDAIPCEEGEIEVPSCDPAIYHEYVPAGTSWETPTGTLEVVDECTPEAGGG